MYNYLCNRLVAHWSLMAPKSTPCGKAANDPIFAFKAASVSRGKLSSQSSCWFRIGQQSWCQWRAQNGTLRMCSYVLPPCAPQLSDANQATRLNLEDVTSPCSAPNCASIFLHTSVCNFSASWNLGFQNFPDTKGDKWWELWPPIMGPNGPSTSDPIQVAAGIPHRGRPSCFVLAVRIDFPEPNSLETASTGPARPPFLDLCSKPGS